MNAASRVLEAILRPPVLAVALLFGLCCSLFIGRIKVPNRVLEKYPSPNPKDKKRYVTEGKSWACWNAFCLLAAGAWLTFKLGAKWAAWQHVIKMPDSLGEDRESDLKMKKAIGSLQLGRFLNGTARNAFSGGVGWAVAWVIKEYQG